MFSEDDLLPLSALQHLLFCQRQCALIHIEGLWDENRLTALGKRLHERAHREGERELRGNVCIARGVRLRSLRLGLAGKADIVEFHLVDAAGEPAAPAAGMEVQPLDAPENSPPTAAAPPIPPSPGPPGAPLPGLPGLWWPFPVEYKRGRPKRNRCDEVQVCAQALCLEEMLGVGVPAGALFYGTTRRRFDVAFDAALRAETEDAARRLHAMIRSGVTPRV
ncbi:MAG: Dna2/Cas4 domain-containing protein, partial [Planctomycetota bacterium]|nr:Dna2/Cas4 domain-containing protein [Planctomycetota bacterium]